MYKRFSGAFCLILALLAISSCRHEIRIDMALYTGNNWGVPQNFAYAIYDKAAAMFQELPENRDIEIVYKTGSLYRDYSERLAQTVLTGKEPDLFLILEEDFNTYASIGLLENLSPYIEKDAAFDTDVFYSKALEAGSYKGQQYSLPISIVPSFLIVNKTLLTEKGIEIDRERWDWNQFYEICSRLTSDVDGDGLPDRFGVYGYDWHQALISNDQHILLPDTHEIAFSNERLQETLVFLKDMYRLNRGRQVTEKDFEQGNVGFKVFNFSEYKAYGSYPYRIIKYANFEWEAIPMPQAPRGFSSSKLYTVQVGMSSRSNHKKAAFRYMKFLTQNPDFQYQVWRQTNNLPSNRTVVNKIYSSMGPDGDEAKILSFPFLNTVIRNSYIDPNFKWYDSLDNYIDQEIFQIIARDMDIPEGVESLRENLERKLVEYR